MNHFRPVQGVLHAEAVNLEAIAADVGTPTYVYSRATFERHYRVITEAMPLPNVQVCYSVKACSNLSILKMLGKLGGGADVVSGGELERARRAGIPGDRIVFSGVGKQAWEIEAALTQGVYAINAESLAEAHLIAEIADNRGLVAPISLRVNPNVDPKTHPYIATGLKANKFGIALDQALAAYRDLSALPSLRVAGVACHIGSQLTDLEPIESALTQMLTLIDAIEATGNKLDYLDMGGGLGIPYDTETPPSPTEYGRMLARHMSSRALRLIIEPGRVIAGNSGVLLTRVIRVKDTDEKRFVIVDAGMNDLIRPALYQSYHGIEVVRPRHVGEPSSTVDVVGPICESSDAFARGRELPTVEEGDLLVLRSCGAYSFSMASNYNSRPRPAEVLVDADRYAIIRRRETLEDLMRGEEVPEWLE